MTTSFACLHSAARKNFPLLDSSTSHVTTLRATLATNMSSPTFVPFSRTTSSSNDARSAHAANRWRSRKMEDNLSFVLDAICEERLFVIGRGILEEWVPVAESLTLLKLFVHLPTTPGAHALNCSTASAVLFSGCTIANLSPPPAYIFYKHHVENSLIPHCQNLQGTTLLVASVTMSLSSPSECAVRPFQSTARSQSSSSHLRAASS